jgi:hypothetical protein
VHGVGRLPLAHSPNEFACAELAQCCERIGRTSLYETVIKRCPSARMDKQDDKRLRETVLAELERRRKAAREQDDRVAEQPARDAAALRLRAERERR